MIVPAHSFQKEIRAFVERGLWDSNRRIGPAWFMGWATPDEGLVAGLAFHDWYAERGTLEISGYSSRRDWLSRAVLAEVMDYVFEELGCRIVTARTSARNARVRRIARALGATEVILPRMRGDREDEVVAMLHRDDWLKSRFKR